MLDKGLLIAIEGVDGAGKTTQVQYLRQCLAHFEVPVEVSKEPTSLTAAGKLLGASKTQGRYPLDEEVRLFLEDRREHVEGWIRPWMEAGKAVIVDRYYFSMMAYQGASGADWKDIQARNEAIAPVPDWTFILDTPVSVAIERITHGRGEATNLFENADYLRKVYHLFRDFAELLGPRVVLVDGTRSAVEVFAAIRDRLVDDGPVFRQLCLKANQDRCEPAWCSARDGCPYIAMNAWRPDGR